MVDALKKQTCMFEKRPTYVGQEEIERHTFVKRDPYMQTEINQQDHFIRAKWIHHTIEFFAWIFFLEKRPKCIV